MHLNWEAWIAIGVLTLRVAWPRISEGLAAGRPQAKAAQDELGPDAGLDALVRLALRKAGK